MATDFNSDRKGRDFVKHSIAKSILALILVVSLLAIGITMAMSVYEADIFVRETVVSKASNAAQVTSRFYSGVYPETMIADEAVSAEISDTFQSLIKSFQLEYLYIVIPDVDSGQITYVCVEGNEEKREIAESLPPGTVREGNISDELASVMRGETLLVTCETDNQYGHVFSVYVPLSGPDGSVTAVIGADISADYLSNRFERALLWRTIFSLATVILSAFIFYRVLKRKVIKPAETISATMKAFGENDNYDVQPIVVRGDNEFSHIGTSFNYMAANTRDYIARIKAYTELQNRQAYEFSLASEIQQGFLPEPHYADAFSEISALMVPARNVGGDFYDYFEDRGHMVLVVADVSGKGISGAIFMASVISMIRGFVKQGMAPGKVLEAVNCELEHSNPNMMFITAFLAFADPKAGVICYANAGHNPPYLLHEGKQKPLSASNGVPLGLFAGEKYQTVEEVFPLGSTVFLYTDGVNEAVDRDAEFFGMERLEKILSETDGANAVTQVKNELNCFTAGGEQSDDITMLSFTSRSEKLTLPAEVSAYSRIRNWILMDDRIPKKMQKRLCLIAEECFVNICSYAYDRPGGITICHKQSWEDGTVAIQFTDSGKPFDQTRETIKAEDYDPDNQIGGLGRLITQSFADYCRYVNIEGNNVLLIIKYFKE
ncbi:MAG: SpoIIE family protein phosphatase [Euryarchaeota archaeon]|nr:SpoIIE family protein phosphatase [Euryarchaeota archaeon]